MEQLKQVGAMLMGAAMGFGVAKVDLSKLVPEGPVVQQSVQVVSAHSKVTGEE